MDDEEILVKSINYLNKSLVIEKEMVDDRMKQLGPHPVVMEYSGKNLVRYTCDGLNLTKNNILWGDEDNPSESYHEGFTLVKKKDRGRHKLTHSIMEINT